MSTRNVDELVRAMGVDGISESQEGELARSLDEMVEAFRGPAARRRGVSLRVLDALQVKCREC